MLGVDHISQGLEMTTELAFLDRRPSSSGSSGKAPLIQDVRERLDEYGFAVLENLIPARDATAIAERLKAVMRERHNAARLDQSLRGVLSYEEDLVRPLVLDPTCLSLAELMLGPGFQTAEVSSRWLKPGAPAQDLHVDVRVAGLPEAVLRAPDVCILVNCLWLLTDFTFKNGATLLIPFSHHSKRGPRRGVDYQHLIPVEGPAGSVVVMHGSLWHKGGANITQDQHRVGLGVVYQARWVDPAAGRWQMLDRNACDQLSPTIRALNKHSIECRMAEETATVAPNAPLPATGLAPSLPHG
jgi:hypothetical protein